MVISFVCHLAVSFLCPLSKCPVSQSNWFASDDTFVHDIVSIDKRYEQKSVQRLRQSVVGLRAEICCASEHYGEQTNPLKANEQIFQGACWPLSTICIILYILSVMDFHCVCGSMCHIGM